MISVSQTGSHLKGAMDFIPWLKTRNKNFTCTNTNTTRKYGHQQPPSLAFSKL